MKREINLNIIAALLTLAGYSINDTIVVFDRIRENIRLMPKSGLGTVINESVNQTLSRTIITSVTVFLVCLGLYFFGGEVLHGFSLAMLMGVIIGTYSSIFVASPIIYEWDQYKLRVARERAARRANKTSVKR
jgi:preprotein translocase SecF subunit